MSIFEGVILRGNRIVVPQSLRKQILSLAHETHQGIVKTKQFPRTRFFWPGMDDATEKMIKHCQSCVVNQPLNKYTPLQPTPLPRGPWVKGVVDLVGPVDGKFMLTYMDYYSSHPEAYILKEITSREVIKALTDIFARFRFPEELVSDNGKQFISEEFKAFLKSCGIRHMRVCPYYARSNGKLERFHWYLKKIFGAVISEGKSWQKELPNILMTYRASPQQISGKSPSMLLFNHEIRTKVPHIESNSNTAASALDRDHRSKCSLYQAKLKDYHDTKQHVSPHNFRVGNVVSCGNMKPKKLNSKFSLAKHVNIARDTFSLINGDTGTTLVRNAKYLKHAPSESIDDDGEVKISTNYKESNNSSDFSSKASDACDNTKPSGHVDEQASQNEQVITTRS